MTATKTGKKRRRTRKFDLERARNCIYEALFHMRRMDFDLIQSLTYASGGGQDFQPSEYKLLQLIGQSDDLGKALREAESRMRPYVKKRLASEVDAENLRKKLGCL